MPTQPYLSLVVTTRNDDHGGDLMRRTQTFVNCFLNQCTRYGLDAELIIVDWNPPAGRLPLVDVLRLPPQPSPCTVRVIQVPAETHYGRYQYGDSLPLYQMIGKNAGIRRARGEFILATNIDVLFSDELMEFLSARKLQREKMYRIDRHDAAADVPVDAPPSEQLAYCAGHLLRINCRRGTFPLTANGERMIDPEKPDSNNEPNRLFDFTNRVWNGLPFRIPFSRYFLWLVRQIQRDHESVLIELPPLRLFRRVPRQMLQAVRDQEQRVNAFLLHTNACGDFTLLHRDHWIDLRGYPEFDLYSMNIDSLFCFTAYFGGAAEVVLEEPMRLYHIEHGSGSGWTPEGEAKLYDRLAQKGVDWLPYSDVLEMAHIMEERGAPMIFNRGNWGLGDDQLLEFAAK